jgi:hypothetical protein
MAERRNQRRVTKPPFVFIGELRRIAGLVGMNLPVVGENLSHPDDAV